jgi:hypothetical protein
MGYVGYLINTFLFWLEKAEKKDLASVMWFNEHNDASESHPFFLLSCQELARTWWNLSIADEIKIYFVLIKLSFLINRFHYLVLYGHDIDLAFPLMQYGEKRETN